MGHVASSLGKMGHLVAGEADPVLGLRTTVLTGFKDINTRGRKRLYGIQVRTPGQRVHHIQHLRTEGWTGEDSKRARCPCLSAGFTHIELSSTREFQRALRSRPATGALYLWTRPSSTSRPTSSGSQLDCSLGWLHKGGHGKRLEPCAPSLVHSGLQDSCTPEPLAETSVLSGSALVTPPSPPDHRWASVGYGGPSA